MKKLLITIAYIAVAGIATAQYISEVYEYNPAPGQWLNVAPWGTPDAMESIKGGINGSMTLGAFGGYVVFGFENPVENDPQNPYGVDFSIFGNSYDDWSEPAVVYVMKDDNQNGLPDDIWYLLAGSDYFFSSSIHDYEVTYTNPGGTDAEDIPWTDNKGNSGVLEVNNIHPQPWYPMQELFPQTDPEEYTLWGSFVSTKVDVNNSILIKSYCRTFGYADNHKRNLGGHTLPDNPYTYELENSGGDAFDISWAVNEDGEYVDLEMIHFVKVQSAALANAGILGEISTEVCGAVDVSPNDTISGPEKVLVMKDLPVILTSSTWQMEYAEFENGRIRNDAEVEWTVSMPGAYVDDNDILHVPTTGVLTITATSVFNPELSCSQSSVVDFSSGMRENRIHENITLYPVPASHSLNLLLPESGRARIINSQGVVVWERDLEEGAQDVDVFSLGNGVYLFVVDGVNAFFSNKFVIKK